MPKRITIGPDSEGQTYVVSSDTLKRPRHGTYDELARAGVELLDARCPVFRCGFCHQTWSPNLEPGGWLPQDYWKCPHGCNRKAV